MPSTDDGGLYSHSDGAVSKDMASEIDSGKAAMIRDLIERYARACGPIDFSMADEKGYLPPGSGGYMLYELGIYLNSVWVGDELLNDDYGPRNRNLYHAGKICKLDGYKRRSPRAPYNEVWVHRDYVDAGVPVIHPKVAALKSIRKQLKKLFTDMRIEEIEETVLAFTADAKVETDSREPSISAVQAS